MRLLIANSLSVTNVKGPGFCTAIPPGGCPVPAKTRDTGVALTGKKAGVPVQ